MTGRIDNPFLLEVTLVQCVRLAPCQRRRSRDGEHDGGSHKFPTTPATPRRSSGLAGPRRVARLDNAATHTDRIRIGRSPRRTLADRLAPFFRRQRTRGRVELERPIHQRRHFVRDRGLRGLAGRRLGNAAQTRRRRHRRTADDHAVGNGAERIEVGPRSDRGRCGVKFRRCVLGRRIESLRSTGFAQAQHRTEIEQHRRSILAQQDVRRLEIAIQEAARVNAAQRFGQDSADRGDFRLDKRCGHGQPAFEIDAVDALQRQPRWPLVEVDDERHAGAVELAQHLGFAPQPGQHGRFAFGAARTAELDRNRSTGARVDRSPDTPCRVERPFEPEAPAQTVFDRIDRRRRR